MLQISQQDGRVQSMLPNYFCLGCLLHNVLRPKTISLANLLEQHKFYIPGFLYNMKFTPQSSWTTLNLPLHYQTLSTMERVRSFQTLLPYCKITWHHNLEDFDLNFHCCFDLKYCNVYLLMRKLCWFPPVSWSHKTPESIYKWSAWQRNKHFHTK